MTDNASERREFFRLNFKSPVQYKDLRAKGPVEATTRNISQNGVLFQTGDNPPNLSSLVWMNLDMRTLKICQEIENRAIIFNNGVIGKVVRVEEDPENVETYDIGVCFLRKEQRDSQEVQQLLAQLAK